MTTEKGRLMAALVMGILAAGCIAANVVLDATGHSTESSLRDAGVALITAVIGLLASHLANGKAS